MHTRSSSYAPILSLSVSDSFAKTWSGHGLRPDEKARTAQQRGETPFRFSAFEEKTLWGDLADTFHLVYTFSSADDAIRKTLAEHRPL